MVFPIGDDNRDRKTFPFVNYLLIAVNIFVYVYYQRLGQNEDFTLSYATIPAEVLTGQDITTKSGLGVTPQPVQLTLITSMFMHGGLAHLLGNMMYLWIF